VYPHIGDPTNLAGYPSLKPNIIFCVCLLDHNLSLSMDHQFKEDRWCQDWRFQVSLQRKSISDTYLIYRLFDRGRATSKHGGGGRYDPILEFKRGANKKVQRGANKKIKTPMWKSRYQMYDKKWWEKERKKEWDIWEKEKNMSMRKKIKIKWTPRFSKVH
jgi:hypothetical protein